MTRTIYVIIVHNKFNSILFAAIPTTTNAPTTTMAPTTTVAPTTTIVTTTVDVTATDYTGTELWSFADSTSTAPPTTQTTAPPTTVTTTEPPTTTTTYPWPEIGQVKVQSGKVKWVTQIGNTIHDLWWWIMRKPLLKLHKLSILKRLFIYLFSFWTELVRIQLFKADYIPIQPGDMYGW